MAEVAFRTVTRTVRLAVLLQQARLRAALQYRLDLVLTAIMGIAYQASGLAFVWVVLSRFGELAGWGFAEIALLCGLRVLAHALWLLPFNAIIAVDRLVREGEFDRYLVRPLNPLVQVLTTRVVRMGSFGDMVTGVVLFVLASRAARVDWSVAAVVFLVLAVVGGALIEGAVQLALGALSFRLIDTMRVRGLFDRMFTAFGSYPLSVFGGTVEWLLTFVLPLAFVAYLPAEVLLDGSGGTRVAGWVPWLALPVGLVLFAAAYWFWTRQLRRYESVGH